MAKIVLGVRPTSTEATCLGAGAGFAPRAVKIGHRTTRSTTCAHYTFQRLVLSARNLDVDSVEVAARHELTAES